MPLESEGVFTVLAGEPYLRDRTADALATPELANLWASIDEPVRDAPSWA